MNFFTQSMIMVKSGVCNYHVYLVVSNSCGHPSGKQHMEKTKQITNETEKLSKLLSTRGNGVTDTKIV